MTALRPVLRPISTIVIAAQLALVLQPLSALAQDKGQQSINPLAQNQLNRIHLMSRDIEAAKAQKKARIASMSPQGVCAPWSDSWPTPALLDGVRTDAEAHAGQAFTN